MEIMQYCQSLDLQWKIHYANIRIFLNFENATRYCWLCFQKVNLSLATIFKAICSQLHCFTSNLKYLDVSPVAKLKPHLILQHIQFKFNGKINMSFIFYPMTSLHQNGYYWIKAVQKQTKLQHMIDIINKGYSLS